MTENHGVNAMAGNAENGSGRRGNRWRIAAWAAVALVLLLPLVAMQVTEEVVWDVADFALAGALLVGTGLTFELAVRRTDNTTYRAAVGVALVAAFILIWVNVAVGVIGAAGDDANLMYVGVLAVGILGALVARFRPHGMARALFAMALAQAVVALIAMAAGLGAPASGPMELLFLNGFFIVLWVGSAWLFWRAAREQPPAAAGLEG